MSKYALWMCAIVLLGSLFETTEGNFDKVLTNNHAAAVGHKWVMQRCMDMESFWTELHPIHLKMGGSGKLVRTSSYGVTGSGRRHLLGRKGLKRKKPRAPLPDVTSQIYDAIPDKELLAAVKEMYGQVHKEFPDYSIAAQWVEEICFTSKMDRGPDVLEDNMPPNVFQYMVAFNKAHGGTKPIEEDTEGPCVQEKQDLKELAQSCDCQIAQAEAAPVNMIVIAFSMLIGLGIGIGGTMYVVR
ncbi:hypothetical protein CYMTET_6638 [Cymbomonas tetramitiformis]|uniref:Uncharacterized protein n=1 Tax=Cymbomonas tetramitiformis TaxID=36881 RepID=A0AAE0GX52_9CHLO|nr:hypothetical protein CYMTET_6638 [Cymbomonas tetramitiformis]